MVDYSASPYSLRQQNCASSNMMEYAVWTPGIAKAPGVVNTSKISLLCTKDLEKKRLWKKRSKGCET